MGTTQRPLCPCPFFLLTLGGGRLGPPPPRGPPVALECPLFTLPPPSWGPVGSHSQTPTQGHVESMLQSSCVRLPRAPELWWDMGFLLLSLFPHTHCPTLSVLKIIYFI